MKFIQREGERQRDRERETERQRERREERREGRRERDTHTQLTVYSSWIRFSEHSNYGYRSMSSTLTQPPWILESSSRTIVCSPTGQNIIKISFVHSPTVQSTPHACSSRVRLAGTHQGPISPNDALVRVLLCALLSLPWTSVARLPLSPASPS